MNRRTGGLLVFRMAWPFKLSLLFLTLAALLACIPPAIQFIPQEAFGYILTLLFIPVVFVYSLLVAFSYQFQFHADGIVAEVLPNPFLRAFKCSYADISGIQKGTGWSALSIFRFQQAEPFRIAHMEILEGSPARLLEELKTRTPGEVFIERITDPLRRWWAWHRLLINILLLLLAAWLSLSLLSTVGTLAFPADPWDAVLLLLLVSAFATGFLDLAILRMMNREA